MANVGKILAQILSSPGAKGFAGGLAGGLLTSKAGRKMGKKALQLGGVAAVGALAWTAYDRWRRGQLEPGRAAEPVPLDAVAGAVRAGFLPAAGAPEEREQLGLLLVRTMIAAARADGKLDGRETDAIFAEIGKLDLDVADKAALLGELATPVPIEQIVAEANSTERATEVYTAALLAIDLDTAEERRWVASLREQLGLAESLAAEIQRRLEAESRETVRAAG